LLDYYINQNRKEQHINFNPESHSFQSQDQQEIDEFVDNYQKIRFNSLSHDHPDHKEKSKEKEKKSDEYTVIKFNNQQPGKDIFDNSNKGKNSSRSIDPNRTIIKICNSTELNQERLNKMRILNNLNKNSDITILKNQRNNFKSDKNVLYDVKNGNVDAFGKPVKIGNDLSKERKGYPTIFDHKEPRTKEGPKLVNINVVKTNEQKDQNVEVEKAKKFEEYMKMLKYNNLDLNRRAKVK